MNLSQIKKYLREAPNNFSGRESHGVRDSLKRLKQEAVASRNENFANSLWSYEQILTIQDKYIAAFDFMKESKFYDAWCCFAYVEKAIHIIKPHHRSAYNGFHIEFIADYTAKFQMLFPYRLFLSIEAINKVRTCSICGMKIKLRTSCGHKVGDLYWGEYCARMVQEIDLPAISLVEYPEDKCCVAFAGSGQGGNIVDNYNYSLVSYPVSKLRSPFHKWDFDTTLIRQKHSHYSDVADEEQCPCASGKSYAECCLPEAGVLRPHYNFNFDTMDKSWVSEFLFVKGENAVSSAPAMSEQNTLILNAFTDKIKNW